MGIDPCVTRKEKKNLYGIFVLEMVVRVYKIIRSYPSGYILLTTRLTNWLTSYFSMEEIVFGLHLWVASVNFDPFD